MKQSWFTAVLLIACGLAIARVWGPFHISALGPKYVSMTLAQDRETEWHGAIKIAQICLAPVLNNPAAIVKAIRDDYVRVVYYDGQIADFKITKWPSFIPLDFDKWFPVSTHLGSRQAHSPKFDGDKRLAAVVPAVRIRTTELVTGAVLQRTIQKLVG